MGVGALWDEKWKGALYFFLFWFPLPGRTVRKGIFFVLISHLSTIFEWQECSWFSIRICFSLYIANIYMTLMGWVMSSSLVKGLGVSGTLETVGSAVLKWVTHSQVRVLHGHCLLHSHFTSQLCKSDSWKCSKKWRGINWVIFADCYSLCAHTSHGSRCFVHWPQDACISSLWECTCLYQQDGCLTHLVARSSLSDHSKYLHWLEGKTRHVC